VKDTRYRVPDNSREHRVADYPHQPWESLAREWEGEEKRRDRDENMEKGCEKGKRKKTRSSGPRVSVQTKTHETTTQNTHTHTSSSHVVVVVFVFVVVICSEKGLRKRYDRDRHTRALELWYDQTLGD